MGHLQRITAGAAALCLLSACGRPVEESVAGEVSRSWNPAAVTAVDGIDADSVRAHVRAQLEKKPEHISDDAWKHTKTLYAPFDHAPLWMDEDGLIEKRARATIDALVNATSDAIVIDMYPMTGLAAALSRLEQLDRADKPTAEAIAQADVLLTAAYASLGEDYLTGMIDPQTVGQSWHIDPREEAVDSALARSLRDPDLAGAIGRMRPMDRDYELLRRKLADYRAIVRAGGWPAIPDGKALKEGDRADVARIRALRHRLRMEGINVDEGDSASTTYDGDLADAVGEFQRRHAIVVDKQLGKETLDAMNVPATFRLAQIAANLERYRWLPRTLGDRYILVNVPAFRLEGYQGGKKVIEMKVVVGAEYEGRATPVFSDRMEFVVFRPYWNVTDNIAQNELFPQFARTGMPADYETYNENGVTRLRQKPGPKNSLGLVKFMFPNDFNIYLHDTPARRLFQRDVRAFSHGCIRVENPRELAQWVLGWSEDRVEQAMENGPNNRYVNLPAKIPVYIAYMTTFVRDGQLWFGNDVYKRDDQLAQAVAPGAMPSPEAVRTIATLKQLTE
jgi:murein L,D-transpeptidase YcbB/YkuD